jgi:RNA polymerase sigma factor (TIGR02999 family)
VTEVLEELRRGSAEAKVDLYRLVYGELRRIASGYMRRQPRDHTLQPTALIHEAWLRLMSGGDPSWNDRSHFLAVAARAMRSILVDLARSRGARRRALDGAREARQGGEGEERVIDVLAVHEALERLESVHPHLSRIVELRFFGGLSTEETARMMEVSERTIYRSWEHARAWLFRAMTT